MIIILSPSKTLDFQTSTLTKIHTSPAFLKESSILIKQLRKYSPKKIATLMGISEKLALLNVQRYKDFSPPFTMDNARQALLAFKGDVYTPMQVESYSKDDLAFAQNHLRILSGLYGVLRPLDLIQPYRLEMGISLPNPRGKNLYDFWNERITQALNNDIKNHKNKSVINIASVEYFHSVKPDLLEGKLLTVVFKEKQKGSLKIIGLFAKKARGMMANFVIKNGIDKPDGIKSFNEAGYGFQPSLSGDKEWVFIR